MTTSSKLIRNNLPCPSCSSSDAYCEYDDGHGYCFSCTEYFSAKREFGISNNYTYEFVPFRGIEKSALIKYDVKTKIDPEGKPIAVGFKYPTGATKVRHLGQKDFYWTEPEKVKPGLFGRDMFSAGEHKYVTIVEGELDALSLWQVLGSPVVSVQSCSSALRDVAADRTWLQNFERIYLAFDGDAPGRDAAAKVARAFDFNKVYDVKFTKHKDANEYLKAGEALELRNIWWNAKRYQPDAIVSTFSEFEKILTEPVKSSIPYPFPSLNEKTFGIRTGESVLITAQEGVGKTELMHAIEHKILKETTDGVGAIFLEEPKRRHLQAVAGLELRKPVHLPDCVCSSSEVLAAIQKVVVEDERLHIYSHFGSDDPDTLLDIIRYLVGARNVRYILLDHITMAVSGLAGEDERRSLDYLSTRLEMMVKELDFALILVSHVNDFGQTRGSRYISKIADIRIDAVRNLGSADETERNTTYLSVSKNRFSGRTGPACSLLFDTKTYTFSEVANDNWQDTGALPDDAKAA